MTYPGCTTRYVAALPGLFANTITRLASNKMTTMSKCPLRNSDVNILKPILCLWYFNISIQYVNPMTLVSL